MVVVCHQESNWGEKYSIRPVLESALTQFNNVDILLPAWALRGMMVYEKLAGRVDDPQV